MNFSTLLMGIIPLILFVIIDTFSGPKAAVITAIIFAIAEVAYSLIVYKKIDSITIGSLLLIVVFGLLTYKTNNAIYFKLQPVIFGVIFGIIFVVMQVADKPLLIVIAEKYKYLMPLQIQQNLTNSAYLNILSRLSFYLGFGFLIHSSIILYSVFYLSNWWWLIIRGIGLYVMMALCVVCVRLF